MAATTAPQPTEALLKLALRAIVAKKAADDLRPIIHGHQQAELDAHEYLTAPLNMGDAVQPAYRITLPAEAWMMEEGRFMEYWAGVQARNQAAGYFVPVDHCPLLTRENVQLQAERAFVDATAELRSPVHPKQLSSVADYDEYLGLMLAYVRPFMTEEFLRANL